MPMISRYSSPFAAAPTIPSTIAAMTSSRKRIVLRLFLASTGGQRLYTMRPTGSDLLPLADTQGSEEFPDWGTRPLASTRA
jgi:hypothetical protein